MKHPGVKTRFMIDDETGTLVDVSTWLNSVNGSSDTEFHDATTFQPDVVGSAIKDEIPGFASKGLSLAGLYSDEVDELFSAIEGKQGLAYFYAPDDPNYHSGISGVCSCGSFSGPQSEVGGMVTFTAELKLQTRVFEKGTQAVPIVPPVATTARRDEYKKRLERPARAAVAA